MAIVDEHIKALEEAIFLNDPQLLKDAVEDTIGVFSGSIDGIKKGLDRGRAKAIPINGTVRYDDIGDARKLVGKLRLYQESHAPTRGVVPAMPASGPGASVNVFANSTAVASASSLIDFNATISQVNEMPNSVLNEKSKQELIDLLDQLNVSQGQGKGKVSKAAKAVCDWLFDKGVEAIPKVMPFVTQAIAAALN